MTNVRAMVPALAQGPAAQQPEQTAKVARDFEAMLLRQMLSCLENTTNGGTRGPMSGGAKIHTAMMVNVLADALAAAGGLGLADVVAGSLKSEAAQGDQQPDSKESGVPTQVFMKSVVP